MSSQVEMNALIRFK